jgi:hypothetical protein
VTEEGGDGGGERKGEQGEHGADKRARAATPAGTLTGDPGLVHTLLERLGIHFSGGAYTEDAAAAREAFFAASGELHEEDRDLFEPRMTAFLEWYVLEWTLRARNAVPVAVYLADAANQLSSEERDVLARLMNTRRSLFSVKKVGATEVIMEDLLAGGPVSARERRGTIGFTKGDVCEARLVASEGGFIFTKTLLFHPRDAARGIRAAIEAARRGGEDLREFPFRLTRLYLRWHRQGHVAAARIYKDGLKEGARDGARDGSARARAGRG